MGRYRVEMKKFKDGSWYTKTSTDSYAAACSVASTQSNGHEYNVIDTHTGKVMRHEAEDASMKEFMLDKKNASLWRKW